MANQGDFSFQIANNKGVDQTARMRRLVCAFVVRKHKSRVSRYISYGGPCDVEAHASWPQPGYAPRLDRVWVYMYYCLFIVF